MEDKKKYKGESLYCAAINCSNNRTKHTNLSFFRFPKDPERAKKWVANVRREDLRYKTADQLHKSLRLCSFHFEPSQFMNPQIRNHLIFNAVPTVFDLSDNYLGRPSRKKPWIETPTKADKTHDREELNNLASPSPIKDMSETGSSQRKDIKPELGAPACLLSPSASQQTDTNSDNDKKDTIMILSSDLSGVLTQDRGIESEATDSVDNIDSNNHIEKSDSGAIIQHKTDINTEPTNSGVDGDSNDLNDNTVIVGADSQNNNLKQNCETGAQSFSNPAPAESTLKTLLLGNKDKGLCDGVKPVWMDRHGDVLKESITSVDTSSSGDTLRLSSQLDSQITVPLSVTSGPAPVAPNVDCLRVPSDLNSQITVPQDATNGPVPVAMFINTATQMNRVPALQKEFNMSQDKEAWIKVPHSHDLQMKDAEALHQLTPMSLGQPEGRNYTQPEMSNSHLAALAIANQSSRICKPATIYNFITKYFPFFRMNDEVWKSKLRKVLSLGRFFQKMSTDSSIKRGHFWCLMPSTAHKLSFGFEAWRKSERASDYPSMAYPDQLDEVIHGFYSALRETTPPLVPSISPVKSAIPRKRKSGSTQTKQIKKKILPTTIRTDIRDPPEGGFVRPHLGFSHLVSLAIANHSGHFCRLSELYSFISHHFPSFIDSGSGGRDSWKSVIRNYLSQGKIFQKLSENNKRGDHFWALVPSAAQRLMEGLELWRDNEKVLGYPSMAFPDELDNLIEEFSSALIRTPEPSIGSSPVSTSPSFSSDSSSRKISRSPVYGIKKKNTMEHSFDDHVFKLKNLCRLCGRRCLNRQQRRKNTKIRNVLDFQKDILIICHINVFQDSIGYHSPSICEKCIQTIRNLKNNGSVTTLNKFVSCLRDCDVIWTQYNSNALENECGSCAKYNSFAEGTKYKKQSNNKKYNDTEQTTSTVNLEIDVTNYSSIQDNTEYENDQKMTPAHADDNISETDILMQLAHALSGQDTLQRKEKQMIDPTTIAVNSNRIVPGTSKSTLSRHRMKVEEPERYAAYLAKATERVRKNIEVRKAFWATNTEEAVEHKKKFMSGRRSTIRSRKLIRRMRKKGQVDLKEDQVDLIQTNGQLEVKDLINAIVNRERPQSVGNGNIWYVREERQV